MTEEKKDKSIRIPGPGYISKLPEEMLKEVRYRLPEKTQNALTRFALVNKLFYNSSQADRLLLKLFQCIEERNKEKVAILLKMRPELTAVKCVYLDGVGRVFSEISPFQFALWSLDIRSMCHTMLDCLPQNQYGDQLRLKLLDQAESTRKGLPYAINGRTHLDEPHFNLFPLLNSLQAYLDINDSHFQELTEHWCTVVGKEQLSLPVVIRHFICSYRENGRSLAFWESMPDSEEEDEEEQPRRLQWNNKLEGLGSRFAIICPLEGETCLEPVALDRALPKWARVALVKLSNLHRVILEKDLPYLFECLKAPNRINEHSVPSNC
jgi:hypothetical protein